MNTPRISQTGNEAASGRRPRVVLRADAGRSIGFGHFVRTTALAAYLRDHFTCEIASHNPEGRGLSDHQTAMIAESGASPLPLEGGYRGEADRDFLSKMEGADIVVLDNYFYSTAYQAEVRSRCKALVCIDDVHDRHFVADTVMTFCPLSRSDFSLEDYTRFYGGIEWSFLREPFLRPVAQRKVPEAIRSIVMAMGGADPLRLSDRMISVINSILPDVRLNVIAGETVRVSHAESDRLRIMRNLSALEIADLFDSSDLGIFPASTVCVEAFSRRLPVIAGHYVDNQKEFYTYGTGKRWFAPLGCLSDSPEALAARLAPILERPESLQAPEFNFVQKKQEIIDIFKSLIPVA